MLAIELTLNLFILSGILLLTFFLGFMVRRFQISSLKRKIFELEKEMLSNYADILELQKNKALHEQNLQTSRIPVIPLNASKEESTDKAKRK